MTRIPPQLRTFVATHPEVEAVIQRIGHGMWDLVCVDVEGEWIRWVVPSEAVARELGRALGIRVHRGWDDPRMARRMNRLDAWSTPGATRRAT